MGQDGELRPNGKEAPLCRARLPSQDAPSHSTFPTNLGRTRQPLPQLLSKYQKQEREQTTLQEVGTGSKQSVPNFLLRGWWRHVPSQPRRLSPAVSAPSLSPCVLSDLPNIAAWSLSTVLFSAYFPSPKGAKSAVPSLNGCVSVMTYPQPWKARAHALPGGSVLGKAILASMGYGAHRMGLCQETFE